MQINQQAKNNKEIQQMKPINKEGEIDSKIDWTWID